MRRHYRRQSPLMSGDRLHPKHLIDGRVAYYGLWQEPMLVGSETLVAEWDDIAEDAGITELVTTGVNAGVVRLLELGLYEVTVQCSFDTTAAGIALVAARHTPNPLGTIHAKNTVRWDAGDNYRAGIVTVSQTVNASLTEESVEGSELLPGSHVFATMRSVNPGQVTMNEASIEITKLI